MYIIIINVAIANGIIYGFIMSLPLVCGIDNICVSSVVISVPYFSFIFSTKVFFCSSVISLDIILTVSSNSSTFCNNTSWFGKTSSVIAFTSAILKSFCKFNSIFLASSYLKSNFKPIVAIIMAPAITIIIDNIKSIFYIFVNLLISIPPL